MSGFYTFGLARRLNLTPSELYDRMHAVRIPTESWQGRVEFSALLAKREVSDMGIAARALIGKPELERAFREGAGERPSARSSGNLRKEAR